MEILSKVESQFCDSYCDLDGLGYMLAVTYYSMSNIKVNEQSASTIDYQ